LKNEIQELESSKPTERESPQNTASSLPCVSNLHAVCVSLTGEERDGLLSLARTTDALLKWVPDATFSMDEEGLFCKACGTTLKY
ncbi:hypothetical protein AVEN_23088-1, partial [Araneus ventricosus]